MFFFKKQLSSEQIAIILLKETHKFMNYLIYKLKGEFSIDDLNEKEDVEFKNEVLSALCVGMTYSLSAVKEPTNKKEIGKFYTHAFCSDSESYNFFIEKHIFYSSVLDKAIDSEDQDGLTVFASKIFLLGMPARHKSFSINPIATIMFAQLYSAWILDMREFILKNKW